MYVCAVAGKAISRSSVRRACRNERINEMNDDNVIDTAPADYLLVDHGSGTSINFAPSRANIIVRVLTILHFFDMSDRVAANENGTTAERDTLMNVRARASRVTADDATQQSAYLSRPTHSRED